MAQKPISLVKFSMTQKVIRTGNSYAVTIPAKFAKILGLKTGQDVEVEMDKLNFKVTYTFGSSGQLPLQLIKNS